MPPIHSAGHTHRGNVRDRNEDSWACHDRLPLAVVADGMGGHPAGHVASRIAVDAVLDHLGSTGEGGSPAPGSDAGRDPGLGVEAPREGWGGNPGDDMEEAVRRANREILERGDRRPRERGMGTTLTALRLDPAGERYVVGHVGDSRAYLFRDGRLTPLTRDDSPLQERVDAGLISREDARVHPLGHVLSQALGTQPEVSPQVVQGQARPGDLFLLCSDGLVAVLSEDRIEDALREGRARDGGRAGSGESARDRLDSMARELVAEVLDRGAPDNVTVVLVEVSPAG